MVSGNPSQILRIGQNLCRNPHFSRLSHLRPVQRFFRLHSDCLPLNSCRIWSFHLLVPIFYQTTVRCFSMGNLRTNSRLISSTSCGSEESTAPKAKYS